MAEKKRGIMKKTPLYEKHIMHNGKMVDFANFKMPIQYSSIIKEVKAVRESVGLFDVSHMGEIEVSGADALDFVNWVTTNNVANLEVWQAQYTTMLYPEGGIVDDLLVYRLPERILLVVNASNQDKDFEWIMENKKGNIEIKNRGEYYFQLALQGPLSKKVMKKILKEDPDKLKFYWAKEEEISGIKVIISRTGYTGEDGFEIYGDAKVGSKVWDLLMKAGETTGIHITPCGLGARDILRLEMGYCLYGNDISRDTIPLEAGLSWIVKMDKSDFIGKESLAKKKEEGLTRKLIGMNLEGRAIPRHGYLIYKEGKQIGEVTSGYYSPTLGYPIAMGYVARPFYEIGTKLEIEIRKKMIEGEVITLPFWKNGSLKR